MREDVGSRIRSLLFDPNNEGHLVSLRCSGKQVLLLDNALICIIDSLGLRVKMCSNKFASWKNEIDQCIVEDRFYSPPT